MKLSMPRWVGSQGLPAVCQVCGRWPAQAVCDACMRRFAAPVHRCTVCARPMPEGCEVCGECLCQEQTSAVRVCVAALDYAYPWDGLIGRFKFRQEPGWAHTLAQPMAQRAREAGLLSAGTWLVPVPVGRERLAERGYNQSWELCKVLQRQTQMPALADALVRVRQTPDQHRLAPAQRLRNLHGAFAAHPQHATRLQGARVLLVDDVRTTGATLEHAARALRQVGVADVCALVLARTSAE